MLGLSLLSYLTKTSGIYVLLNLVICINLCSEKINLKIFILTVMKVEKNSKSKFAKRKFCLHCSAAVAKKTHTLIIARQMIQ